MGKQIQQLIIEEGTQAAANADKLKLGEIMPPPQGPLKPRTHCRSCTLFNA